MEKSFAIIGGDMRNKYLHDVMLEKGFKVNLFGLGDDFDNCYNLEQSLLNVNYVVSAIPFSREGKFIAGSKNILVDDLINSININQKFFAGQIKDDVRNKMDNKEIKYFDLLEYEPFNVLNTIPTVEGAIKVAIEETNITVNSSKVLVLGYGRIGKMLSGLLKAFGADVFVEARKQTDFAWALSKGLKYINLSDLENYLGQFEIIFNTVPYQIITEDMVKRINKNAVFIELASKPYGVDFGYLENFGIKYVIASGLPGKICPKTSAHYIFNSICEIIKGNK